MANTCEPPKCRIGKKGGVSGAGGSMVNAEAEMNVGKRCHVFTHVFQPPVLGLYELPH